MAEPASANTSILCRMSKQEDEVGCETEGSFAKLLTEEQCKYVGAAAGILL